jgi:hypothetical protein
MRWFSLVWLYPMLRRAFRHHVNGALKAFPTIWI